MAAALAAVSTWLVLLGLLSPGVNRAQSLYLVPVALAGSILAVMTQTRAQDEAAIAAHQRELNRVRLRLSLLDGHQPGATAPDGPAPATLSPWQLPWAKWSAWAVAAVVVVTLVVLIPQLPERYRWPAVPVVVVYLLTFALGGLGRPVRR